MTEKTLTEKTEEAGTRVYEPGFNPMDTVDHERIKKEKMIREAMDKKYYYIGKDLKSSRPIIVTNS